jgi:large conductance mechanosensitive channel
MLKEFRQFAVQGNMIDLAVGVVLGAAFGLVINSIVNDVLMPFIAALFQAPDFTNLFVILKQPENATNVNLNSIEEVRKAGGVALGYGLLINAFINFLIVAFALFMVVRTVNRMRREEPAPAAPAGPTQEQLLMEIRDLLKNQPQQ